MLTIRDRIAGERIYFHYVKAGRDLNIVAQFIEEHNTLALDTESTGINCYKSGWQLRTVQVGNARDSFVVPARYKKFIAWVMREDVNWIGHNGPHDIRSIDEHLGFDTGVVCKGETYIPSHHLDSRNRQEGGVGHGLKELAMAHVDKNAGKWEQALKAAFKEIMVALSGEVYKSGPRKGTPKYRKAHLSEGYALIDPEHPAYIAYAASDPILTYRVWRKLQTTVRQFRKLYRFDHAIQQAADILQRRAILLDTDYTGKLSRAFSNRSARARDVAAKFGCNNINSTQQLAAVLAQLGVLLHERTPTGQYKVDSRIMRALLKDSSQSSDVREFLRAVLRAKQLEKRRESYTEQMLREADSHGRVHPSINILGARTARMSVSNPPLQQLPTKDREDEAT